MLAVAASSLLLLSRPVTAQEADGLYPGLRRSLIEKGGGTKSVDAAIEAGLLWLARHQAADGRWDPKSFVECCEPKSTCAPAADDQARELDDCAVGVTGLALSAFTTAGYSPDAKWVRVDPVTKKNVDFGAVVAKGLQFLIGRQTEDGSLADKSAAPVLCHALALAPLVDAYQLTWAEKFRAPTEKAVRFLETAANPMLGWRYHPKAGQNDTVVTGSCVLGLASARLAGFNVSETAFDGAEAWIARMTTDRGVTGYDRLGEPLINYVGKDRAPLAGAWRAHETSTAIGTVCRLAHPRRKKDKGGAAARAKTDPLFKAAAILAGDLPTWSLEANDKAVDYYYWHWGTLALFELDGPAGPTWKKWGKALLEALLPHQREVKDGCLAGSWDAGGVDRWAWAGGRVYAVAMNVLTLETYHRLEIPRQRPVVTIQAPKDGLVVAAASVALAAKVTARGPLEAVVVMVGGSPVAATVENGAIKLDALSLPAADGPVTIEVRARDAVLESRARVRLVVDRTPPGVTIEPPKAPFPRHVEIAELTVRTSEPGTLRATATSGTTRRELVTRRRDDGTWSVFVSFGDDRELSVDVEARDKAGHTANATAVKVARAAEWKLPARLRSASRRVPAAGGREVELYLLALPDGSELEMVYVPGASPGDSGLWIGRHEVTWASYRAFCGATKRAEPAAPPFGAKPDHPVVNVAWTAAREFCQWGGVVLPRETECIRAVRGTDSRSYPWGDQWATTKANHADRRCPKQLDGRPVEGRDEKADDGYAFTAPVGSFATGVSPCGALDLAGNVAEWCENGYSEDKEAPVCGGSFRSAGRHLTWVYNEKRAIATGAIDVGFRVVLREVP